MTQQAPSRHRTQMTLLFAMLAAAIFSSGWYLSHRTTFLTVSLSDEVLVTGAMTVVVPLLYFGLVAVPRKQGIILLLIGFLICSLAAEAILPEAQETALEYVKRGLVVTEGLVIVLVTLKISRIVRYVAEEKALRRHYGFTRQLKAAIARAMGSEVVGELVASEVASVYYSLFFFALKSEVQTGGQPFTIYKTGYKTLFIAFSTIGLLELGVMHLLLYNSFSPTVAWVVTALSIYGFLFLLADYVAMVKRPSMIYQGDFYFQMGLRWAAVIPLDQIRRVDKLAYNLDTTGMMKCAVQKHLANIVIYFTEERTVTGPFGIRKRGEP